MLVPIFILMFPFGYLILRDVCLSHVSVFFFDSVLCYFTGDYCVIFYVADMSLVYLFVMPEQDT